MGIRYKVTLTSEEREYLEKFSKTGTKAARSVLMARALLLVDAGEAGPQLSEDLVSQATILSCRPIERLKSDSPKRGLRPPWRGSRAKLRRRQSSSTMILMPS